MARLVLAAFALLALTAGVSSATPTAGLLAAYVSERDAAIADATRVVRAEGAGTPAAREAADDAAARLASLAEALEASTRSAGPAATALVEARLDGDAGLADALARYASGAIDAPGLAAARDRADQIYTERHAVAASRAEDAARPLGPLDIAQALGGPGLLVGAVALMTWRAARRRRSIAAG